MHERRELFDAKIHAGGGRHEQRGPLRAPLTQLHRRRSGDSFRFGRNDELNP